MSSISTDIAKLTANTDPYTAKASIKDGVIDESTSTVTGDRTTDLFSSAESGMGKDDFLMLLVTQLRYQDPLNPMEPSSGRLRTAQIWSLPLTS